MSFISKYFNWLQRDTPTGEVEKYPEIDKNGETSVKGIYIIGDLTGIPLLKLAAESGANLIKYLMKDEQFKKVRESNNDNEIYDLIIVGAGPSGIAAGIEAKKNNLIFKILESSQKFNTIINFPKGKPIIAAPEVYEQQSGLKIHGGIKESLLEELKQQIEKVDLPIQEGVMVEKIEKKNNHFELVTKKGNFKTLRVVLAIGKSGNARRLKVPGENLPKVYNRLIDPADAKGQKVLVVGGGDSALETAIATAEYAESVTVSYRKPAFSRAKEANVKKLNSLVKEGKVRLLMETNAKEIRENSVIFADKNKEEIEIENSMIFTMIGRELPLAFFKRSGIKMEGEWTLTTKLQFLMLIFFGGVVYFGKSSAELYHKMFGKIDSFGDAFSYLIKGEFWSKFFHLPSVLLSVIFSDKVQVWSIDKYINAFLAYIIFIAAVLLGAYLLVKFIKENYKTFSLNWQTFKYTYFVFVGIFFLVIFFGGRYFGVTLFGKSQAFYYTALYSLTILIFGLRRINVKPTRYIKRQTWSLMLIQVFALFLLPEFIFPYLGSIGALGGPDSFMMAQVFPSGNWVGATPSYWRSYGFILAWPLNLFNLYNGDITTFWLVFSLVQTFVIIPYIVYRWGKGAYCGWICSCGAMAETLGDEYRVLAPHGAKPKRLENIAQWVLLAAFLVTALKLLSVIYNVEIPLINENISYASDFLHNFYYIAIDIIFAGVLGIGVYFFLSGRIWCRFGCPLAALMHIYSKFSRYRIFAEKKKCISCNICTKVCHMGIDVMNYANKGIPMNDVECVRCSACIVNCPTDVLSFGSLPKSDPDNTSYKKEGIPFIKAGDWRRGL